MPHKKLKQKSGTASDTTKRLKAFPYKRRRVKIRAITLHTRDCMEWEQENWTR